MKGGIQAEGDGQHASKDLKDLVVQVSTKEMDQLEYEDAKQEVERVAAETPRREDDRSITDGRKGSEFHACGCCRCSANSYEYY